MSFVSPIGKGLTPERIDQGVDYGGQGSLYALGAGQVANVYNSGWPGGTFLTIHLSDTGQYVYYTEDLQPTVKVGQTVKAGQLVAKATGGSSGVEIGWAAPPGTGNTMAMEAGQTALGQSQGDPGKYTTAYGLDMSKLIQSLGGPGGIIDNPVQGSVPSSFDAGEPTSSSNTQTAATSSGCSFIDWINPLKTPGCIAQGVGNSITGRIEATFGNTIKDILMRLGLILLGGILIIVGIFVLVRTDSDSGTGDMADALKELIASDKGPSKAVAGKAGMTAEAGSAVAEVAPIAAI